MKHIAKYSLLLAFLGFSFGACSDDEKDPETGLEIVSSSLQFEAGGGTGTVAYFADVKATAEIDADWARVTEITENKVTIQTDPLAEGLESRAAVVTLRSGSFRQRLTLYQAGMIFNMAEDFEASFDWMKGGTASTPLLSNYPLTVEKPSWLDVSFEDEKVVLTVIEENEDQENSREATVVITSGQMTREIKVVQNKRAKKYEQLLGEWKIDYSSTANNNSPSMASRTVKLIEDVPGESFLIDNWTVWNTVTAQIKAKFNYVDGTISIYNGQFLLNYRNTSEDRNEYVHLCIARLTSNTGNFNWYYQTSYYFKYRWDNANTMVVDKVNSLLPDDQGYGHGFVTYGLPETPPTSYNPSYSGGRKFFFYMTFEKL